MGSHEMADELQYMNKYKSIIKRVGQKHGVAPSIIAGIISRETRAGTGAGLVNGWGDNGNGFGLMQVDKNWHKPRGRWDSEEHLSQATEILVDIIGSVRSKFPSWTAEQQLRGGLAAYNTGLDNVHSYSRVDENTTGGDYSRDVLARATFYRSNGY
ncbi:lysozyme g-like isoform X2 [Coregonus clupeaformis]|uniref:lysozyme g-like isoform X1 n=1 Tax=Coregonus clupeaformis TaxID=59861 RepID=UPI001E1C4E14|nr:lysozyme g-like isoform X1 [Coregonus clupeaformis]XP_045061181.1 lysozyme g-like isoform X2 [Coregonus clupeaformis]